uniref:Uncharacterized protein n=1 Tax=Helianthus annuus TaxID=4232 RepID=A0A251SAE7_HELAN
MLILTLWSYSRLYKAPYLFLFLHLNPYTADTHPFIFILSSLKQNPSPLPLKNHTPRLSLIRVRQPKKLRPATVWVYGGSNA